MGKLDRLIEIGLVGKSLIQKSLYRRLLPAIIRIGILTVITSLMLFTMLIGIFGLGYQALVAGGMLPNHALLVVGMIFVLLTIIFALLTFISIRRLRKTLSPFPSRFQKITSAFLDGLSKK